MMKKSTYSLVLIIIALLVVHTAQGRYQRMIIPKGISKVLRPNSASKVAAYCYDMSRPAPELGASFNNILAGGKNVKIIDGNKAYTFDEAIDKGIIAIEGRNNRYTPNTLLNELEKEPLLLYNIATEGGVPHLEARQFLNQWNQLPRSEKLSIIQENIFDGQPYFEFADHTTLNVRNLTNRNLRFETTGNVAVGSKKEYIESDIVEKLNLSGSAKGNFEEQNRLWAQRNEDLKKDLWLLDGYSGPIKTGNETSPKEAISKYQSEKGITSESGKKGPKTTEALVEDKLKLKSDYQQLGYAGEDVFDIHSKFLKDNNIPVNTPYKGKVQELVDDLLKTKSLVESGEIGGQILANQKNDFGQLALVKSKNSQKIELWETSSLGSPLQKNTFDNALMRISDAQNKQIAAKSTDGYLFINANHSSENASQVTIVVGNKKFMADRNTFESFLLGKTKRLANMEGIDFFDWINAEFSNFKKLIVYQDPVFNPLTTDLSKDGSLIPILNKNTTSNPYLQTVYAYNQHQLAANLTYNYGDKKNFFLTTNMERAKKNIEFITAEKINNPEKIAFSYGKNYRDFGISKRLEGWYKKSGVKYYNETEAVTEGNIVVFNAHKDDAFRNHIKQLGENGYLKDKFVVLLSCHEKNETAFNELLLNSYGANGTLFFDKTINAGATEAVVKSMLNDLKKNPNANTDLYSFFQKHVREVLNQKNVRNNPEMKKEVEKLLRGIVDVKLELQTNNERI